MGAWEDKPRPSLHDSYDGLHPGEVFVAKEYVNEIE